MNISKTPMVVLICDNDYLIPTVSTALSVRSSTSVNAARAKIFVLGTPHFSSASAIADILIKYDIEIEWITIDSFDELASYHRDRYLPPITLARFWLDSILDDSVVKFLYLDGDIMVDGSLEELLSRFTDNDKLYVCRDNMQIFSGELSPSASRDKKYLLGLNLRIDEYFNAGVILCCRTAWSSIVPNATKFFRENSLLCRSSDQSALNYSAKGKTEFLPQRFNYQTEHMMLLDPRSCKKNRTTIYHFTGGPKPWRGSSWPWDEHFNKYYQEASTLLGRFNAIGGEGPLAQSDAGIAHRAKFRFRNKYVYPWRAARRRNMIKRALML